MAKIIGIENVDYTSKRTGNRVTGKKLYFTEPLPDDKGEGLFCDNVFVTNQMAMDIEIGDEVDILYNKYGNVADLRVANCY